MEVLENLKTIAWAPEKITLESLPCPICGGRDIAMMRRARNLHLEPALFTNKGYKPYPMHADETSIARCHDCGLVQTNPRRKSTDLIGLNNALHLVKDYKDGKVDSGEILTGEGDRALREDRIARVMKFKRSGKWLDVGCGAGRDLDLAVEKGFEGYGVELSDVKKDFYKNKKFTVHVGSFENTPFPPNSFDVISMWDVLEHVEEPNHVLAKVGALLKPEGLFVAKVPNHASLYRRLHGVWWDMYHPLHLYYFTRDTMGKLLSKHGLDILHAETINPYGLGCLAKDILSWRRAKSNVILSHSEGSAAALSQGDKKVTIAKSIFRAMDYLPKRVCLQMMMGNFLIVYARRSAAMPKI